MKKLLISATALALLAACATESPQTAETKVDYVCPLDTNFTVVYSAEGDTATLYDQADRVFVLKNAPAASGAYYTNEEGVSLHTKRDDAIIELVKNRPIQCTVWRGQPDGSDK